MLQRHRHIVIFLLLFSYLLLGAAGYLETVTVLGFGTNPHHITNPADSHSSTFKVYYTQHKHIPSTVKISVPSPAVFTPPEVPRIQHSLRSIIFFTFFSRSTSDITRFFNFSSNKIYPRIMLL
jgi:hypothetical protein